MPLEGWSERSKHPTTRNRFFVPNARRNGRRSRQLEQLRRGHGDSRRNCLHPIARGLSLAAFRSQYRAYDTPSRSGVRSVPPLSAFPSVPAIGSASGCPALFVGFTATVAECDFLASVRRRLRLLAFPTSAARPPGQMRDLPVP
jgi:hypothetical protein